VTDIVPRHRPHFSLEQRGVDGCPVHESRLRFHYPKIPLQKTAREIVTRPVVNYVEVPGANVVVPGGEIEIATDSVMIKTVEPSHHVRRDPLPAIDMGSQSVDLILLIAAPRIAYKALPI
jgi:hypothetical protein